MHKPPQTHLYDADFYAWTATQAQLLASQQFNQLDIANLVEEITSLGKQQEQELENRLGILLGHLLKWHYQPEKRSKSWRATIREQRKEIQRHLKKNPSLKSYFSEALEIGYENGLSLIDRETPLDPEQLPQSCPFSDTQIFDEPLELPQP
ncbi:hypothetical protein GlitD10_0503 [Gloeomargarita lithophora Alchichica-D10]|uniref:DUF29 domain-containing protein n=1 Tax=Gloeomargarita lithophora Alchichica-D10 TaxID=1188229 RepID=A0A1J0AA60_9CYAN|nr:DUF29 domain-containing protein [Gloeomargarita lithophora]APB32815.1 hypothetical protein GlitD10_0503 [Gloeomargarita lithophora Alchichica-D10]